MSDAIAISLFDIFERRSGFTPQRVSPEASPTPNANDDLYSIGLADGQLMAETAFSLEREKLHQLIASANALRTEDNEEIELLLNNAIRQIVHKIVGDLTVNPDFLNSQIKAATELLTEADQGRAICLHPADLALLKDAILPLPHKLDPTLPIGGIRIECSDSWIEHGPAFALQRLERALDSVGALS